MSRHRRRRLYRRQLAANRDALLWRAWEASGGVDGWISRRFPSPHPFSLRLRTSPIMDKLQRSVRGERYQLLAFDECVCIDAELLMRLSR